MPENAADTWGSYIGIPSPDFSREAGSYQKVLARNKESRRQAFSDWLKLPDPDAEDQVLLNTLCFYEGLAVLYPNKYRTEKEEDGGFSITDWEADFDKGRRKLHKMRSQKVLGGKT